MHVQLMFPTHVVLSRITPTSTVRGRRRGTASPPCAATPEAAPTRSTRARRRPWRRRREGKPSLPPHHLAGWADPRQAVPS